MDGRYTSIVPRDLQDELFKVCSGFSCDEKVRTVAAQYLLDYKSSAVRMVSRRVMPI